MNASEEASITANTIFSKIHKEHENHTDHKKGWDTLRNTEDVWMLIADVITERHQEC